jgi:multidrug efflux system membrane fusion protein
MQTITPLTILRHFALVLVAALVAAGCAETAAQPAAPPPPQVTVATVASGAITEWEEFTGRLEAVNTVAVRPRVSGYVSAVRFTEGALVRSGDVLFQIDPRPFQAEVDRLRAELERARATVERAGTELQRAERLAAENAISREERERRASFVRESGANEAAVAAALRAAELNLEFTRVTAPIDGRISRAIVTEGNLVTSGPGEATLLTTVVSLDPIYAVFDADEQTFLRHEQLARGRGRGATEVPIHMALANDDGFPHVGALNFVDNQLDPETGTIRGRAVFRNADRALVPGLFVRLRLPGHLQTRGVLIDDRAVGTDLDKRYVYVVNAAQEVEYRAVTLGPLVDDRRVVRSGLRDGDRVIVNGVQRVRPGAAVTPVEAAVAAETAVSE